MRLAPWPLPGGIPVGPPKTNRKVSWEYDNFSAAIKPGKATSTLQRLALSPSLIAIFSSPRGLRCGIYRYAFMTSPESPQPASAQRFWIVFPRGFLMLARQTASTCVTSCRFAPVTTIDNGISRSAARTWRLLPFFPLSAGVGPADSCAISTLPTPGNAFYIIIFCQPFFFHSCGKNPASVQPRK